MASLSIKALTAKIETLLSEKNAGYTECQEKKRRVNELLTIQRNIDQALHGASSQRRNEVEKLLFEQDRWQEVIKEENKG